MFVAAATLAGACDAASEAPTFSVAKSQKLRAAPTVSAEDRVAFSSDNAAFALKLFKQVEKFDKNVVISPTSISTALAMTYAGARGETERQMSGALEFKLPQARLHAAMNWMDQELANRGQGAKGADGGAFRLKMINALWSQSEGFVLNPEFLDVQAEHYGAGVNLLNFMKQPEQARVTINDWVANNTESKIKDLIAPGVIDSNTALVLTNAIYLNAAWKTPFKEGTRDGTFERVAGAPVTVKMMNQAASLPAVETPTFVAVALPYQDERLSMLVVVPKAGTYAEFEAALTSAVLDEVVASLRSQSVIVNLPRFKFDFALSLRPALSALGMPVAFVDGAADFSGISPESLHIQAVVHKAFIAVAEKGTEAAAATAVVIGRESAPQGLLVNADRPFLFFLRDEPTGALLFMGRVMDPSL